MLLYSNIVGTVVSKRVIEISRELGFDPNWLMEIMYFESEGIDPTAVNPNSGASGVIQFTHNTARGMGTTLEAIRKMTTIEQLYYVRKFYLPYKGRIKHPIDLYLVTFYPAAIGKPDSWVLGSQVSTSRVRLIAGQNPSYDSNRDLKITVGELKRNAAKRIFKHSIKIVEESPGVQIAKIVPPTPTTDNAKRIAKGVAVGVLTTGLAYSAYKIYTNFKNK